MCLKQTFHILAYKQVHQVTKNSCINLIELKKSMMFTRQNLKEILGSSPTEVMISMCKRFMIP